MRIHSKELQALLGLLGITQAEEINCEEFLSQLPGFLELLREKEVPEVEGHQAFLHHLKLCPECIEEFEALYAALRDGTL